MKTMDKRRVKMNRGEEMCKFEKELLQICNSDFVLDLKYSFYNDFELFIIMDVKAGGDLNFLIQQQKWAEAEEAIAKAVQLKPEYADAHMHLGLVRIHQKKLAEAEQAYAKAVQLKPEDAVAHGCLGATRLKQKKWVEGEQALAEAARLDPKLANAHKFLGYVRLQQKKWAEAEASLAMAVQIKLEDADTLFWLGDALAEQKKRKQAEEAYAKAVKKTSPEKIAERLCAGRVHENNEVKVEPNQDVVM